MRSRGAIRSFWSFLLITALVDIIWLLGYSPLRPLSWDMLTQLSRKDQLACIISAFSFVYKLVVITTAVSLSSAFAEREALLARMEREAGVGPATSSSGEPLDARSLAAQAGK